MSTIYMLCEERIVRGSRENMLLMPDSHEHQLSNKYSEENPNYLVVNDNAMWVDPTKPFRLWIVTITLELALDEQRPIILGNLWYRRVTGICLGQNLNFLYILNGVSCMMICNVASV